MNRLRLASSSVFLAALIAFHPGAAQAAAYNYHGSLQDSGKPAEGSYDLELTLYTSPGGGSAIGGPLLLYKVPVHAGSFSTAADFGPLANVAGTAWLGVRVRLAGSSDFAVLSARSPVSAADTASVCPGAWTLDGNSGTSPGTGLGQNYIGTADGQPLVLAINGAQAGRFSPSPPLATDYADAVTVVFGSPNNSADGIGAVVGGGGSATLANCGTTADQPCVNEAPGLFSTVAGGKGNFADNAFSTVSGGTGNSAEFGATVGGGGSNSATVDWATVGGGENNYVAGYNATIPGGLGNFAGDDLSFAAGVGAVVRDKGAAGNSQTCSQGHDCGDYATFVWSDGSTETFTSSGPFQFLIQAVGGVGINTNVPAQQTFTVAGPSGAIAPGFVANASSVAVFENNAKASSKPWFRRRVRPACCSAWSAPSPMAA
jgi:hypothetical protein